MLYATCVYEAGPLARCLVSVEHGRGLLGPADADRLVAAHHPLPPLYVRRAAGATVALAGRGRVVVVLGSADAEAAALAHALDVLRMPWDGELLAGEIRGAACGLGGDMGAPPPAEAARRGRGRLLLGCAAAGAAGACCAVLAVGAICFIPGGCWS